MKIKTITLSGPWHNDPNDAKVEKYRVLKITDSVDYAPHAFLTKREVESLCESAAWKVTVVPLNKDDDQ